MRVYFHTLGCKANQYDTERMRQELEARGARPAEEWDDADVCVVNTCTVTSRADAEARRIVRKMRRENPEARIVVAGCSAALKASEYRRMKGVAGVVKGQDPVAVAGAALRSLEPAGLVRPRPDRGSAPGRLVQLGLDRSLDRLDQEPVGAEVLSRRRGMTRGWLKIQDGCDRKCAFCATRLARGRSRSRAPDRVIREARSLADRHPELVLTGIHIGHFGRDLEPETSLSRLVARLLEEVPGVRVRLGSVEATEVDDLLLELLAGSDGRLAPHLHMPLQSGADPVLRRMRRWHTREMYRFRALEIAARMPTLGLGADIITGFPGETEDDHASTRALVEELPYTYVHVFPFSPREGTAAADLAREEPVPERVAGERSRELRELVREKGRRYREGRVGEEAVVIPEGDGTTGLTGDYLRVDVRGGRADPGGEDEGPEAPGRLRRATLRGDGDHLYIDLSRTSE